MHPILAMTRFAVPEKERRKSKKRENERERVTLCYLAKHWLGWFTL